VKFIPGRGDTNVADQDDLLPSFGDDFHHSLFYFLGNGEPNSPAEIWLPTS
jgi:hypothetical protein